jgi:predicted dehydrogenase
MKVAIFGLGSIGKRHARMLKEAGHDVIAYRSGRSGASNGKNGADLAHVRTWEALDRFKPRVGFIANPTALHAETAIECARRGMDVFIEKPVNAGLSRLKQLLEIVSRKRVATYVGYVLRFHPVIRALKKFAGRYSFLHMRVLTTSYLPSWRPGKDPRNGYSAHREMGGGVLYDLSHEIDYVQYILGPVEALRGQASRRSDVTVDAEDYADILAETERGPANIHINFMSQMKQRLIQMDFREKTVVGDLLRSTVTEYRGGRPVRKTVFPSGLEDCYRAQLRYFFRNLGNRRMMNNVFEASTLFRKICRLRKELLGHG